MPYQFAAEESFPLHVIRTDKPFKIGGGHAVEISMPDAANGREARLVMKTTAAGKTYIYQSQLVRAFRSGGSVDNTSGDLTGGKKSMMNWRRFPLLLTGVLVIFILLSNLTNVGLPWLLAIGALGMVPVILGGFSCYVRTVFEFADDETYIVCYMPERCYYRLHQFELLRMI